MALPKVPRKTDCEEGKMFLVELVETDYFTKGTKTESHTPQYSFGIFEKSLEAEKTCVRMNRRLWRKKEYEFILDQTKEHDYFMKMEQGIELDLEDEPEEVARRFESLESEFRENPIEFVELTYNDLAREKDQSENYYHVVSIDINYATPRAA